jgi:hypothetical protein
MGDNRGDSPAAVSARAKWWVTFALLAALIGLWSVATPLFGSADEPAHVVRAAAVGRGELTGRTPDADDLDGYVYVDLPAIYDSAGRHVGCFAGHPNRDASCFHFDGRETTKPVITESGRHPPTYYAVVGVVSRAWPNAPGATYLMRAATVLIAALLLTIAVRALSRTAMPRVALLGFAVALTPMVLAFSGTVNPSAVEIAAGIATWSCALALVTELRRGAVPDARLVTQLGIAAAAFALSRQTSMFWLALIGLIVAGLLGANGVRKLWRTTTARVWGAVVLACAGAQLAWIAFAKGLELSVLPSADPDLSNHEIVRRTIGRSSIFYLEMLGQPGWLDTTLPGLTYLLLTAALGTLVLLAVAVGARRYLVALLAAIGVTVLVPILLEVWQARSYGFYWQGRYTLPFAVGVPLLAAFALQSENGARALRTRLVPALGGLLVVAQVLAYYQALRRWSVGADGPVFYWLDPDWTAPMPQVVLIVAYAAVFTLFAVWLLHRGRWSAMPARTSAP